MEEKHISSISKTKNLEDMAEFWEGHSLADYEDDIYEVDMEFNPDTRRTSVGLEPELLKELRGIAKKRRISTQTLVNACLRQYVDELKPSP